MAKVFIIDDDPAVRTALSRLMKSAGIECGVFPTGESFLAALENGDRGCVVLDYHMPGSDGPDVLKIMAENRVPVPVIMLSAHDAPETRERARSLGAVAFFRKPVDGQALLDAIAWAMGTFERTSSPDVAVWQNPNKGE